MMLFLNEAIMMGVTGGTIEVIGGYGFSHILSWIVSNWRPGVAQQINGVAPSRTLVYIPPVFTPELFIYVWLFCVFLSAIAGIYPAWRASKFDPVVALRYE